MNINKLYNLLLLLLMLLVRNVVDVVAVGVAVVVVVAVVVLLLPNERRRGASFRSSGGSTWSLRSKVRRANQKDPSSVMPASMLESGLVATEFWFGNHGVQGQTRLMPVPFE